MDAEICGRLSFTITRNEPSFNLSCYTGANVSLTRFDTRDLGSIACTEFNAHLHVSSAQFSCGFTILPRDVAIVGDHIFSLRGRGVGHSNTNVLKFLIPATKYRHICPPNFMPK